VRQDNLDGAIGGKGVVFVLSGEIVGGAEVNMLDLAADLARAGARVSVCALDDRPGRGRGIAADRGIEWRCVPVPWKGSHAAKLLSLARFALQVRRLTPDVVVAATNLPNVVGGLTWRATGASLFVWNQCDVQPSSRFRPSLFRRALHASPLVVTTAYHAREWLVEQFGADPRRIRVVRSKVELAPPREDARAWRSRLGIARDDFVACMVAHLHAGKDHDTLLRAWRVVVDETGSGGPRPVLLLAGRDAGHADVSKALAFDLDLGEQVRFLGEVEDVSGLLAASDVAVFSSKSECLGRGATEPMAAGLPVVGTDVPGIREALGAPGTDQLVPPGDATALAGAILGLMRDPSLRSRLGRANAELVRERQSHDATTLVYARLLAGSLAGRGAVAAPLAAAGTGTGLDAHSSR
jgi:glycosyltransferase involved in cell wall biosynthesis